MPSRGSVQSATGLLAVDDAAPFTIINPSGTSPFLLTGDHAGNAIPLALGNLGLHDEELSRHIGWDIGVGALGDLLANALDATFIRQTYSRLVVDCNRRPNAVDAIPPISDGTPIPGNQALTDAERAARFAAIHEPYQLAITEQLDRRRRDGLETIMISLHSFTPAMRGSGPERPWQVGVLHHLGDTSFALRLLDVLRGAGDLLVGDNEPYSMDGVGYTIPRQAYPARVRYAELEIRQDLLLERSDQEAWSRRLGVALQTSWSSPKS